MHTRCVRGGTVRSGQGVNVPAERLGLPAVTDRDREGLARALDLGVDLIAQSFVRGPDDIEELRELMGERVVPIVAKIETKPAIENIEAILDVTDALWSPAATWAWSCPWSRSPCCRRTCSAPLAAPAGP